MAKYEKVGNIYRKKPFDWGGLIVAVVVLIAIFGLAAS